MVKPDLTEADYTAILESVGGAQSACELEDRGFSAVMARFRALGFNSPVRGRSNDQRDGMASPGQVAIIRKLLRPYAYGPTEARLNTFLERSANVTALRLPEAHKVGAVIAALKAIVVRKGHIHAA